MKSAKQQFSCFMRRNLGEQFATAARLYAEAVVVLTCDPATISRDEYDRLREATKQAQQRSEATERAFEQHVDSHDCLATDATRCTSISA